MIASLIRRLMGSRQAAKPAGIRLHCAACDLPTSALLLTWTDDGAICPSCRLLHERKGNA